MSDNNNQLVSLEQTGADALKQAEKFQIASIWDDEDYQKVADFAVECRTALKRIEEDRMKANRPLLDKQKELKAIAVKLSAPFEKALSIAQSLCQKYMHEQEEKKRQAELKARQEAEAERKRLEEEARNLNVEAAQAQTEGERFIAQTKAMEIEAKKSQVATVVEVVNTPKSNAAMSKRVKFKANVVSLHDFVKYAVENPVFLQYIKVDDKKLSQYLNSTGGQISVPGVEIQREEMMVTSARRSKKSEIGEVVSVQ